ncbi:LamG domain-containing protein [Flavobacterium aquiphilum]|uniref:LamG domain-containing protein n=1 Tax=Flavobacterium aquiphilum TaxID=3003261 RepID=UPI002480B5FB|nr:LamG domain-containing protein [Flavobacterium aquiphilum]
MKKIAILAVMLVFTYLSYAQTPIQEFNFNGTLSNIKNDVSFSGNAKFVNNRFGAVKSAIRVVNNSIEATIFDLPQANSSRTVSIWIKYNGLASPNYILGYGAPGSKYFGLNLQTPMVTTSDLNLVSNDEVKVVTYVMPNAWYNYVVTYDGNTSKIYRNGVLIKSSTAKKKLTSGNVFSIGRMNGSVSINADIDDLKIYNVALTEKEVLALYKGNLSMASTDALAVNSNNKALD